MANDINTLVALVTKSVEITTLDMAKTSNASESRLPRRERHHIDV